MRRARRGVALVILSLLVVAACGSSSSEPAAPPPPPVDLRGRTSVDVDAIDNKFTPPSIIVSLGTKVTWRNKGALAHNVKKSADIVDFGATFGVNTADFGPGASYSFTFAKPGTYGYTCTIHSLMDGLVRVEADTTVTTGTTAG